MGAARVMRRSGVKIQVAIEGEFEVAGMGAHGWSVSSSGSGERALVSPR